MNIKHINIDGNALNLDDENALQLPDGIEPEDGDMLIYDETLHNNEGGFKYIKKKDIPEVEVGIIPDSNKLATSGDVYSAINAINNKTCCSLNVIYDSSDVSNKKLIFQRANIIGNPALLVNAKLLILSINTLYNQQQEELKVSNILDILTLTPSDTYVEKSIDDFSEDRMFYFILFNDTPNIQICKLINDRMLIAGVNAKTNIIITPIFDPSYYPNGGINILASGNVDVDVNIILTLTRTDNRVEIINGILLAGTSSLLLGISASGLDRNCNISLNTTTISSTQNYMLATSNIEIDANVPRIALEITPGLTSGGTHCVKFSLPNNVVADSPVDVNLYAPRSNTSPILLQGTIATGNNYVEIVYEDVEFSGNILYAEMGNRVMNQNVEYYISNPEVVVGQ